MNSEELEHDACTEAYEESKTTLHELNQTIKDMQDKYVRAKIEIEKGNEQHTNEKIILKNNISMETDLTTKKKKFTNDLQRETEYLRLMQTGHHLQTLDAQLKSDKTKNEFMKNEIRFLERKFEILIIYGDEQK